MKKYRLLFLIIIFTGCISTTVNEQILLSIPINFRTLNDKEKIVIIGKIKKIGTDVIPCLFSFPRSKNRSHVTEYVVNEILIKLGKLSVPYLTKMLDHPDGRIRQASLEILGDIGPNSKNAVKRISKILLHDTKSFNRVDAAIALGRIGPDAKQAVPALIQCLGITPNVMKSYASIIEQANDIATQLKISKDHLALNEYKYKMTELELHRLAAIKENAIEALGYIRHNAIEAIPYLASILLSTYKLKGVASNALARIGLASVPILLSGAEKPNSEESLFFISSLCKIDYSSQTAYKKRVISVIKKNKNITISDKKSFFITLEENQKRPFVRGLKGLRLETFQDECRMECLKSTPGVSCEDLAKDIGDISRYVHRALGLQKIFSRLKRENPYKKYKIEEANILGQKICPCTMNSYK